MKPLNLFFTLFVFTALAFNTDLSAQRGNNSAGNRNVRSSANSSVNRNYNQNTNVNRNVNVNQNVNVNRNVNVNTNYHGEYYGGGCCYHPVATAAAVTATAVATAAVVGSIVDRPPAGCVSTVVDGQAYQQCGNTWYQPQMSGTTTTYEVVNPPR